MKARIKATGEIVICTSIEQSQRLIELGIDVKTADMLWTYDFTVNDINGLNVISENLKPEANDIPAWSLTALLGLMPNYQMQTQDNSIGILYGCKEEIKIIEGETPIDAAVEMACWLKENEKI